MREDCTMSTGNSVLVTCLYIFYHTLATNPTNQDHVKGYIDSVAVGTMETVCDIEEPYNITSFVTLVKDGKMFGTL